MGIKNAKSSEKEQAGEMSYIQDSVLRSGSLGAGRGVSTK